MFNISDWLNLALGTKTMLLLCLSEMWFEPTLNIVLAAMLPKSWEPYLKIQNVGPKMVRFRHVSLYI